MEFNFMLVPNTYEEAAKKIAQTTTDRTNEGVFLPDPVVKRIGRQIRERRLQLGIKVAVLIPLCGRLRRKGIDRLRGIEKGKLRKCSVYEYMRLCELLDLDGLSVFQNAMKGHTPDAVFEKKLESFLSQARHRRTLIRTAWTEEFLRGFKDASIRNSRR